MKNTPSDNTDSTTKYCECGRVIHKPYNSTIQPKKCLNCINEEKLSNKLIKGSKTKPKKYLKGKSTLVKTSKKVDKELDIAWSHLVKLIAGHKCEYCGSSRNLNSHHIFSRSKKSVRWHAPNGICLCVGHHIGNNFSAHKTPMDFAMWITQYRGAAEMQKLSMKAHQTGKYTIFEKELLLGELQKEIKRLEANA